MSVHYRGDGVELHHGDCLDILATLADNSIDAVVTDPPYGLEFMGKEWDAFKPSDAKGRRLDIPCSSADHPDAYLAGRPYQRWCTAWATECLRVLKPGGHLLAFGGTRTWHRLTCAIEDAGFEIRDSIAWLYGSGFPKSLDVSKAIDKAAGAEREVVGHKGGRYAYGFSEEARDHFRPYGVSGFTADPNTIGQITAPATDAAKQWQGWGTALKPAHEPIIVARKPLQGTVAANVLAHGTGALNIDGCRVEGKPRTTHTHGNQIGNRSGVWSHAFGAEGVQYAGAAGRWPTNVVLDETQATELMSRFFPTFKYEPKAPTTERPSYYQQSCECENACPITPREKATAATMSPECSSTSKYGNATTVPCPTDTKSTTETKTSSTTESKTSPHSPQPSTNDFIQDANSARASGSNLVDSATNLNLSTTKTGTTAAKAGHYTDAADHATSQKWSQRSVCANCGAPAQLEAHATVKPVDLIRWLIRLVTPPGGTVLDPFAGTGTTAEAAIKEHKQAVLIEREDTYLPLIVARLSKPMEIGFNFEESA